MSKENQTKIRLQIDKTIQPRQYEPIKIMVDIEETVFWKDEEDRQKKLTAYTNRVSEDFVSTFNQVLERIGEQGRCIGRVSTSNGSLINDNSNKVSKNPVAEEDHKTVLDELDSDWS